MIPWVVLDTAPVPGGSEPLRLRQRGTEFSIQLGPNELMNSRLSGSEEALATLTAERLGIRANPCWLIGGYGMGFTLRAALDTLDAKARIVMAELVPAVLDWGRGPLAPISSEALADPRVEARVADVSEVIRAGRGAYDAILLDVDNGPDGLTRSANDRLYDAAGLAAARAALRPGGVLAVWSAHPDPAFTQRLARGGFRVEAVGVRAGRSRGARHTIWLAERPAR
ncbi:MULTISPECIES: spermidine synthase [unclassified Methylobacterium]|uniref:spermidine synthase n=1 Tax=unclassified Methylobacterium TaxID=2615210 RepID=UPI000700100F|nr:MULTISPECIES: spermidine synthase [unclassified Methylobacterium]KQP83169.1 spermidine synthase [Methylobacterium sp. Leaf117]MCK2054984.1 spermidine synthase [Methylobacterium sp. 37f]